MTDNQLTEALAYTIAGSLVLLQEKYPENLKSAIERSLAELEDEGTRTKIIELLGTLNVNNIYDKFLYLKDTIPTKDGATALDSYNNFLKP